MDKRKDFVVYGHAPEWQDLVGRCEALTKQEDIAHKVEAKAAAKRKSVIEDVIRAHDERPNLDKFAARMQQDMDNLGFNR